MLFIDKNHSLLHWLNTCPKSSLKTQEQYSMALFSYLYFSVTDIEDVLHMENSLLSLLVALPHFRTIFPIYSRKHEEAEFLMFTGDTLRADWLEMG